jgi:peptidoglycan/xylan/chitin deacetylase (PgdA/CDA1 family)
MNPKDKLRSFMRTTTLDLLGLFAKPAKGIHILNGHMISRTNPDITIFQSQLERLQKLSTFIKIEEAVGLICEHKVVNDTLLAFTFDDGFEECATMIAPSLEHYGTNGLFFINPNFVEGDAIYIKNFTENIVLTPGKMPMRWNEIIELQNAGHLIGSHTLDHYLINSTDLAELEHQIIDSKKIIENKLGKSCDYFAFPFGKLDHANSCSIDLAINHYKYVFSQADFKNYFSYNNKVINRRHFEPYWPVSHVKYFISHPRSY